MLFNFVQTLHRGYHGLIRLHVRIVFHCQSEIVNTGVELFLQCDFFCRAALKIVFQSLCTQSGDFRHQSFFMLHKFGRRLQQIGNKVVALFELNVDSCSSFLEVVFLFNK